MENITIGDIGMAVAFLVTLISGIAYLKRNLKDWVKDAVKPDLEALHKQMNKIQEELVSTKGDRLRDKADDARRQILIFNDELLRGERHSKEHFDQVLQDVDYYEKYCKKNEDYKNSRAVLAIAEIRRCYKKCEAEGTFL